MLEDVLFKRMRQTRGARIHKIGKYQNARIIRGKTLKLCGLFLNIAKALAPIYSTFFMPAIGKQFFGDWLFKAAF